MTQTEFLLDTLKYYCEDTSRRCEKDGRCRYHPSSLSHSNSEGCAIGRYLPEDLALKFDSYEYTDIESVFDELPENLQVLGKEYLDSIQNFHDSSTNWNTIDEEGLTEIGKGRLSQLIKEYELDKNLFVNYLN